jgi:tetratricopeptide (TPR) repeat protein
MSQSYEQFRQLFKKGRYRAAANLAELQYAAGDKNNPFWLTRQAAALSRAGDSRRALDIAKQALGLQPSNPYGILSTAEALVGLSRFDEALAYYEEIATDRKLSSYAHKKILECHAAMKNWDHILQFVIAWEIPPETKYQWQTKAYTGKNRLNDAIDACHQWLKINPDNPQALWMLTELEIQRDGLESVRLRMAKLAKIPSRPSVYKEIYASLCKRAGKTDLALEQYDQLAQTAPDSRIHRKQAFALAKSGHELEAIPIIEELLKLNPKDLYLHNAYIPACRRVRQLERAMQFYEELLQLHPEEKPLYGRIRKIKNLVGKND